MNAPPARLGVLDVIRAVALRDPLRLCGQVAIVQAIRLGVGEIGQAVRLKIRRDQAKVSAGASVIEAAMTAA